MCYSFMIFFGQDNQQEGEKILMLLLLLEVLVNMKKERIKPPHNKQTSNQNKKQPTVDKHSVLVVVFRACSACERSFAKEATTTPPHGTMPVFFPKTSCQRFDASFVNKKLSDCFLAFG